jgi:hypothetical protein
MRSWVFMSSTVLLCSNSPFHLLSPKHVHRQIKKKDKVNSPRGKKLAEVLKIVGADDEMSLHEVRSLTTKQRRLIDQRQSHRDNTPENGTSLISFDKFIFSKSCKLGSSSKRLKSIEGQVKSSDFKH